jgi:hypothetical protein
MRVNPSKLARMDNIKTLSRDINSQSQNKAEARKDTDRSQLGGDV